MASSSSSATVAVDKATSDLLMGPDWTMNIEICDSINSSHWQPKDVVKAVKKRLQHRSSKVQLLALTLLETMVKNCGDYVHHQIAERNVLDEMIKIVRKKADMQVREKILVLLDSWQEAFGGAGGKHPQYYWAYDELKRTGTVFPKRSFDAVPIFTPPPTHSASRSMHPGYGMPSSSSKTLDETMATEIESLSLSSLDSMRHVMDLLSDMLQAVNPSDRAAVKDEVIIDLVDRCRTNQKKLMQMLTTTGDEELLGQGLELNDNIQSLLARHDALVSGTPLPVQGASSSTPSTEAHSSVDQADAKSASPVESVSTPKTSPSALVLSETVALSDEEEEDEFAQLARRHTKSQSVASAESAEHLLSMNTSSPESSTAVPSNALALSDQPAPVRTSKDQDIIDLLSITLSLEPPPQTTYAPPPDSSQGMHQIPASPGPEGYPYAPQTYPGNLQYNSYVVPWAQQTPSQSESQAQSQQHMYHPQSQSHSQPATPTQYEFEQSLHHQQTQQFQPQPQPQPQPQHQPQSQQHYQSQPQSQQNYHSRPQPQPQQSYQSQPQPQQSYQSQSQPQQNYQSQPQQNYQSQPQSQQHYQTQPQSQQNYQPQPHSHYQPQPQTQLQLQSQPQQSQPQPIHGHQSQQQSQFQNQQPQYASYPPPPWAATPGYPNYQNQLPAANVYSAPRANNTTGSFTSAPGARPLQHTSSFPPKGFGAPAVGGDPRGNSGQGNPAGAGNGQKPFVPSYRLFEDLNVFGGTDGRVKMTGSSTGTSSLPGTMGPGMVGGRK